MANPGISAIEFYLPEKVIDNDFFEYAKNEFLEEKVGIHERHIAAEDQATSDLACEAIKKLIEKNNIDKSTIEFIVMATLTPDYPSPYTSAQLQDKCGFGEHVHTIDVRSGCTGFVDAMSVAYGLMKGMGFKRGLVVTADKYSMYLSWRDYTIDTLLGDNGAALLVEAEPKLFELVEYDFGTRGSGGEHILVEVGGSVKPQAPEDFKFIKPGVEKDGHYLHMNGRQVMKFAYDVVPTSLQKVMEKANVTHDDIDWLVLHQANKLMIQEIGKRAGFPEEKIYINLWDKGNTAASTIPTAMKEILDNGTRLNKGNYFLVSGFGVGLAWGSLLFRYLGETK